MSDRGDNHDQPPEVDVHDDDKQHADPAAAAARVIDFVAWFGDGDIAGGFPSGPPLYARDLEALALVAPIQKPRTITTREELEEAHMVVVRTEAGTIANLVNGRAYCFGYEASVPVATLALPVTVLWEREAAS